MSRRTHLRRGGFAIAAGALSLVASSLACLLVFTGGPPRLRGDLNLDGRLDLQDVVAFVLAARDTQAWSARYGGSRADLLAVGDFDRDGRVTLADRTGFCAALEQALNQNGMNSLIGQGQSTPLIDLDIDSDNTDGYAYPARSTYEDSIEDAAGQAGKILHVNDPNVPLVLEIDASPPYIPCDPVNGMIPYRITFPSELHVLRSGVPQDTWVEVTSGEILTEMAWIKGDVNKSGALDFNDINPFVAILDPGAFAAWQASLPFEMQPRAIDIVDFNNDGVFDFNDVNPFVAALGGSARPSVPVNLRVYAVHESADYGAARIMAEADTNKDGAINASDAAPDQVRSTVTGVALGAAPAWGMSRVVSPFSAVNLQNGNLLTAIPLVSWSPAGPPIDFTLYHNSAEHGTGADTATGFWLGQGWSTSYSAHITGPYGEPTVTYYADDGRKVVYTWDSGAGAYVAPAGVYDLLTWDPGTANWTLRTPAQWCYVFHVFENPGWFARLTSITDSAGNTLHIERETAEFLYRIKAVRSAADDDGDKLNRLTMQYNQNGVLSSLFDPLGREWTFTGSGTILQEVHFPHGGLSNFPATHVGIAYQGSTTHIEYIHPRDATNDDPNCWKYSYSGDRLATARTPNVAPAGQPQRFYTESFSYAAAPANSLWETTYTDRRGNAWRYRFDATDNLRELTTPPVGTSSDTVALAYDAAHHVAEVTDQLLHAWTYTYHATSGRVQTITSPLTGSQAQTWTMNWVQPAGQPPTNAWVLDSATDPNGYVVHYGYADATDPMAVTTVTEPPAQAGGAPAVTTFAYGDGGDAGPRGKLMLVTLANASKTRFAYDVNGFFEQLWEGRLGPTFGDVHIGPQESDGVGFVTKINGNGRGKIECDWPDVNGHPASIGCCISGGRDECGCAHPGERADDRMLLGTAPEWLNRQFSACYGGTDFQYDNAARLLHTAACLGTDIPSDPSATRAYDSTYDALGRLASRTINSNESLGTAGQITRAQQFQIHDDLGQVVVTRPDSQTATYTLDAAGRMETVVDGAMAVHYFYDDAGHVTRIDNTDGAGVLKSRTVRAYDAANRLTSIEHRDAADNVLMQLGYTWNRDNTLYQRTQLDYVASRTTTQTFGYDGRQRLREEQCDQTGNPPLPAYHYVYSYDQLGNRTEKLALPNGNRTCYVYDSDWDPDLNGWKPGVCYAPPQVPPAATLNNRLLWAFEFGPDAGGGVRPLLRTTRYLYDNNGAVAHITVKDHWQGNPQQEPGAYKLWYDLYLAYSSTGQLWMAIQQNWAQDGWNASGAPNDLAVTDAWEFRYDQSGRQRYLARRWNLTDFLTPENWAPDQNTPPLWTDYLGEMPLSDYTVESNSGLGTPYAADRMRYLNSGGIPARQSLWTQDAPVQRMHGDLLASTVLTKWDSGTPAPQTVVYTAFGEPIMPTGIDGELPTDYPRYAWDGGHGYESSLIRMTAANLDLAPITLVHVGERWYETATGRFAQRDPIGLWGARNVYGYAANAPLAAIDSTGLQQVATPWGPSTPMAVPEALELLPPDTPGLDFPVLPNPETVHQAAYCVFSNFGALPQPGQYQWTPPPWIHQPCPHCGLGPCTNHFEAGPSGPSYPPPPPDDGLGIPFIPVAAGVTVLAALQAWRGRRAREDVT